MNCQVLPKTTTLNFVPVQQRWHSRARSLNDAHSLEATDFMLQCGQVPGPNPMHFRCETQFVSSRAERLRRCAGWAAHSGREGGPSRRTAPHHGPAPLAVRPCCRCRPPRARPPSALPAAPGPTCVGKAFGSRRAVVGATDLRADLNACIGKARQHLRATLRNLCIV